MCNLQGLHGIEEDVFLSVPAVLGANGISHTITQQLTEEERSCLQKSAQLMYKVQQNLNLSK